MHIPQNAVTVWSRFFNEKKSGFESLSDDIIIDEIMSRLDMRDIVSLRLCCRTLYHLSRRPAVWKRFLPHIGTMKFPLPLLSPLKKYAPENIATRDIEGWISRAISLDTNWKKDLPKALHVMNYETYFRTLSMVMLPGGHFLVASVRDKNGNHGLIVWVMEHAGINDGGAIPLVWRDTEVKAYNLQARYMTVNGVKGITIAFLRKFHKDPSDTRDIPECLYMNGYPSPEDPYMPLRYECTTLHISLEILDRLTDRKTAPHSRWYEKLILELDDPFKVVSRIRTGTQLGAMTLTEVDHEPHVAVVKRPNNVIFENLNDNSRSLLSCERNLTYPDHEHYIWGIKFLPEQNHVFVIRAVDKKATALCTPILFEFYEVPLPGQEATIFPLEFRVLTMYNFVGVQIAELPSSTQENYVGWSQLNGKYPPTPLSIFLIEARGGFVHYTVWPVFVRVHANGHVASGMKAPEKIFYYSLHTLVGQTVVMFSKNVLVGDMLILPGVSRAIMYSVPSNTRNSESVLKTLNSYISPDHGKDLSSTDILNPQTFPDDQNASNSNKETLIVWPHEPKQYNGSSCKPLYLPSELTHELRWGGVTSIAWDESSGRLCVATKNNRNLTVLEFGFARDQDETDIQFYRELDKPLDFEIIEN